MTPPHSESADHAFSASIEANQVLLWSQIQPIARPAPNAQQVKSLLSQSCSRIAHGQGPKVSKRVVSALKMYVCAQALSASQKRTLNLSANKCTLLLLTTTTCLQVLQQDCAPSPHFLSFLTLTLHEQRSRLDYRCSCLKTSNFVRASLLPPDGLQPQRLLHPTRRIRPAAAFLGFAQSVLIH